MREAAIIPTSAIEPITAQLTGFFARDQLSMFYAPTTPGTPGVPPPVAPRNARTAKPTTAKVISTMSVTVMRLGIDQASVGAPEFSAMSKALL